MKCLCFWFKILWFFLFIVWCSKFVFLSEKLVNFDVICIICFWYIMMLYVFFKIGFKFGCKYLIFFFLCFDLIKVGICFIGFGLYNELIVMIFLNLFGFNLWSIFCILFDLSWNIFVVFFFFNNWNVFLFWRGKFFILIFFFILFVINFIIFLSNVKLCNFKKFILSKLSFFSVLVGYCVI